MKNQIPTVGSLVQSSKFNEPQGSRWTTTDEEKFKFIWNALVEMFGHAVTSSYGAEPPTMWKESISRLTGYQLKWVIAELANADMDFAPNLSQFNTRAKKAPLKLTAAEQSNLDRRRLIEDGYGKIKTLEFQVKNIKEEKFRADAEKRLNEAKRDYMEAKNLPVQRVFE